MYKIVFHYTVNCTETYGGGTYIYQGEKYAILNDLQPKLYKSKKIAERSAKQILILVQMLVMDMKLWRFEK